MITDFFIKRPVLSLVVSVMIVLLGAQAFFDTQVRQYPELETSVINIRTVYPGASAELIQGFISTPIQQAVSSTAGIDYVRSSSTNSVSTVEVHMKLGIDADVALTEISTKVSSIRESLPAEAQDPIIAKASVKGALFAVLSFPILLPIMIALTIASDKILAGANLSEISKLLQFFTAYAVIMITASVLLFKYVWQE